jgi:hypothetical protein
MLNETINPEKINPWSPSTRGLGRQMSKTKCWQVKMSTTKRRQKNVDR